MTITEVTRALLQSLKSESAPWGDRVYLHTATDVLELGGDPASMQWPCLMLSGPEIVENKQRRAEWRKERLSENRTAGTMAVRRWPRFYRLTFNVTFQTRVGFTGSITATEQLLVAIEAFEGWVARNPRVGGADLLSDLAMTARARRPTPADIREATARIFFRDVPVHAASVETVDTAKEIIVTASVDTEG